MELYKIIGVAFVTAFTALILKNTKPELAFAVTVAGSILILIFIFDLIKDSFTVFEKIKELSGIDDVLLRTLLKIVGIGYVTEFSAGILTDFGSASVADKVVFGGKVMIFVLTLPIIKNLMELILSFLSLV